MNELTKALHSTLQRDNTSSARRHERSEEASHHSPSATRDSASASHDPANASRDSASVSHDSTNATDDSASASRDSPNAMDDSTSVSHDSTNASHDSPKATRQPPRGLELLVERWSARLWQERPERAPIPIANLLSEALGLAHLIETHWQPQVVRALQLPGLDATDGIGGFHGGLPDELRELQLLVAGVRRELELLKRHTPIAPVRQAQAILGELKANLSFVLEDGSNRTGELVLTRFRHEFCNDKSRASLAAELERYAYLAYTYDELLAPLPNYDPKASQRAYRAAHAVRQHHSSKLFGHVAERREHLSKLRDRGIGALNRRMTLCRRVLRWVFRDHPDVLHAAASTYRQEARQRQRARRDRPVKPGEC